jgi:putative transcriptional regulator
MSDWQGRLLVATPILTEGIFSRSVVQLLQHSAQDGAVGVVLTRPLDSPLDGVLPGWEPLAAEPAVVFEGGPVSRVSAICLARLRFGAGEDPSYVVVPGAGWLGTVDLDLEAAEAVEQVRVFAGYAGWAPGQLESEVEEGAWWVLEALPHDCFSSQPELLWRQVLRRQGPPLALVATYPEDPALN